MNKDNRKVDYNELYFDEELEIDGEFFGRSYPIALSVQLRGIVDRSPDCMVSHFGYNFYFRTAKGLKGQEYQSIATMKRAIETRAKKLGMKCLRWVIRED